MDSGSEYEYEEQYEGRDEDEDYVYEEQDEEEQPADGTGLHGNLDGPIPLGRQLSSELMSFAIPLDNFVIKPASEIRPILFGLAKGVSIVTMIYQLALVQVLLLLFHPSLLAMICLHTVNSLLQIADMSSVA